MEDKNIFLEKITNVFQMKQSVKNKPKILESHIKLNLTKIRNIIVKIKRLVIIKKKLLGLLL